MSSKPVAQLIQQRYSVRQYLDKDVPEETIRDIINTARLSPSNGNTQP